MVTYTSPKSLVSWPREGEVIANLLLENSDFWYNCDGIYAIARIFGLLKYKFIAFMLLLEYSAFDIYLCFYIVVFSDKRTLPQSHWLTRARRGNTIFISRIFGFLIYIYDSIYAVARIFGLLKYIYACI